MNYQRSVQFLYELQRFGLKLGLENTFRLAALAGNPQERLRFIHVAGTNGKGSTCAFLESIYRAAGLKVGLFTSPHMVSFRERIQINRTLISEPDVARLVDEFHGDASFTFFEGVTVMALKYFAEQQCDVVVWETGLGGRLDSTNIVTPLASIITNVQLDHQQWLGQTLPEIAFEKAGIIKPGVPVITAAEEPGLAVIAETAAQRGAPLTVIAPLEGYELGLAGAHQRLNAALAAATAQVLSTILPVSEAGIQRGLKNAHWAGRLQLVAREKGRRILIDGAHNPAGAQTLAHALAHEFAGLKPAIIFGAMADKDCAGICRILAPLASSLLLCPVGSARTADPHALAALSREANPAVPISVCEGVGDALQRSAAEAFVVVTGSLHFIGEAVERLGLASTASERELNEYASPSPLGSHLDIGHLAGAKCQISRCDPKSKIGAMSFDIGGTLVAPWPSVGHVYAEVAARHGVVVSPEILNRQFGAAWKRKKNFGHSMMDWSNLVDDTFAGISEMPPSKSFFTELYDAFASPAAWRIYDDALPILEALRQRGVKLAAISNWDERLRPLLRKLNLDQYFEAIFISAEVGHAKPARQIFAAAAEGLRLAPASILHVGDSQVEDFEGARAAGFRALLLRRGEPASRPGQISSLAEAIQRVA